MQMIFAPPRSLDECDKIYAGGPGPPPRHPTQPCCIVCSLEVIF